MHLFSQSLSIVLQCGGHLLNVTFGFSNTRCIRWPGFALIWVSYRWVINIMLRGYVCCTRLIQTRIIACPASFLLLLPEFCIPELQALEFEVPRCRTSKFARCFLPTQVWIWNDLPYNVFDSGMLDRFKGAVNCRLLPWVVFSSDFRGAGVCGVAKANYKQFYFF